jgi:hypothetical protein
MVKDSIATYPEDVPYIKQVIKEEFRRYLAIVLKPGVERWS